MVSGDTLTEPRVKDGKLSADATWPSFWSSDVPSARCTPSATAVLTTLHSPTFFSRLA